MGRDAGFVFFSRFLSRKQRDITLITNIWLSSFPTIVKKKIKIK